MGTAAESRTLNYDPTKGSSLSSPAFLFPPGTLLSAGFILQLLSFQLKAVCPNVNLYILSIEVITEIKPQASFLADISLTYLYVSIDFSVALCPSVRFPY